VTPYEHELLDSDATLELDADEFAYAGKFRVSSRKAVTRDEEESEDIVAALSFSYDRADDEAVRVRYITVREDRRREGIGSALLDFAAERLLKRYDRVRISVNNPYSYAAARKAGFGWTGEETGLAELVMERPRACEDDEDARHVEALRAFEERDHSDEEDEFVRRKLDEKRGE
jgi:GNAT superfamily N-acetyltransferase